METFGGSKGKSDAWPDDNDLKKAYKIRPREALALEAVYSLANAIDARNACTIGHSERVTECAITIANAVGLKKKDLDTIKLGGLLHDIGRIVVNDAIINKPAKLTEDEFAQIKSHPEEGYKIIEKLDFLGEARLFTLHHHERFDGKGYPHGLKGEEIPFGVRILTVADAIEAMTSDRPYRKAHDAETVLKELDKCSGVQFDPRVINALLKRMKQKPEDFHDLINPKDSSTYLDRT
jgi:putative nucleotidyltransferase with HDIG domain